MSMELRHLRAFVAVAEELHFRKAAGRLHVAQPALSRTICQLEERVGAPLLMRSTRSVALTDAGRALLPEARATLLAAARALTRAQAAAAGSIGQLSVTYMDFAINGVLPEILARFRRLYPEVQVTLRHLWTEGQRAALLQRDVDIGFLIGPIGGAEIQALSVRRERLCVVLPAGHALARLERVPVGALREQPFVLGNMEAWAPYRHIVDQVCQRAGFVPSVVQEAYNSDGIFGLVASGLGVTLYVEGARSYQPKGVTVRPLAGTRVQVETVAAWHGDNDSPALARFVDVVRDASQRT
jgi:DNA-binding transcriptional LysR family regulator